MILQHYSAAPLHLDPNRTYRQPDSPITWSKPRGLWVSVAGEDDWPAWCRAEDFALERLRHCADIELAAHHHVHTITTLDALDVFTRRYQSATAGLDGFVPGIDRAHVARDYDGLIVTPYLYSWSWGLDSPRSWLYGWDVASGCIWGLEAIATVTAHLQQVAR